MKAEARKFLRRIRKLCGNGDTATGFQLFDIAHLGPTIANRVDIPIERFHDTYTYVGAIEFVMHLFPQDAQEISDETHIPVID